MPIRNIIFDWSGVISDDHETVWQTYVLVFKKLGVKPVSYEEFSEDFFLPYLEWNKKHLNENYLVAQKMYREESKKVPLPEKFQEVNEVLSDTRSKGFRIAIFSSANSNRIRKEMEKFQLTGFFENVQANITNKVESINRYIKKHGYDKKETVYVGDMVHDIHAARIAGIKIIALTRGYDSREQLEAENPDVLIDDLNELMDAIEKLND